jgi:hypothetical protein
MPELERKAPGGLTALGVACVVLGALWLLAGVWNVLEPEATRRTLEQYQYPNVLAGANLALAYVDAVVSLVLGGAMAVAGVGLLRLRRWGARLGRLYAWVQIGWSVLTGVLAAVFTYANLPDPAVLPKEQAEFMETRFTPVFMTELVASVLLSCVFAVILLCLLSRQRYRDALA